MKRKTLEGKDSFLALASGNPLSLDTRPPQNLITQRLRPCKDTHFTSPDLWYFQSSATLMWCLVSLPISISCADHARPQAVLPSPLQKARTGNKDFSQVLDFFYLSMKARQNWKHSNTKHTKWFTELQNVFFVSLFSFAWLVCILMFKKIKLHLMFRKSCKESTTTLCLGLLLLKPEC